MATEIGQRFVCGTCMSEFVVTRGGDGQLSCCEKSVTPKTK